MAAEVIRTQNFVADAVRLIIEQAHEALSARGEFRVALSGGNTPRPVFSELAKQDLPWEKILFTFGDERCVPPDDAQSNYRMAKETLFEAAQVPAESILRMKGELDPPVAAIEYEKELDDRAGKTGEEIFRHDLMLLGMGDDGHTASLFPETAAVDEMKGRVVANFVPKLNTWRITMTFPVLNASRHVCFLVNSDKHADLVEKVVRGDREYPAARVQPTSGKLTWILGQVA